MIASEPDAGSSNARVWWLTLLATCFALISGFGVLWLDVEANRQREQREAMSLAVSQSSVLQQRLESALSSTPPATSRPT